MSLPKVTELMASTYKDHVEVSRDEALSRMRTTYETALVRVKGFVRDRKDTTMPLCFISYAWGNAAHERWVLRLADDLRNADIDVVLDQLDNAAIGSSVARFISRIEEDNFDFILVIGTPSYFLKHKNKLSQYGNVVAAEVDLISIRLTGTEKQKSSILPLLLEGEERTSFPPLLYRRVHGDFRQEEMYFVTLFDLVLTLYHIPFDHVIVQDLRTNLRAEALARVQIQEGW
jgi:TIR domain